MALVLMLATARVLMQAAMLILMPLDLEADAAAAISY